MNESQDREISCVMKPADKAGHPDLCCCKAIDDDGEYEDLCMQTSAPAVDDDCGCCC